MEDCVMIVDYKVNRVNMDETIALMEGFIASGGFHYIVVSNLYCFVESRHSPEFLELANSSDLTVADGMSLVYTSRLLGEPIRGRVSGWDLFELFSRTAAQKGYTYYLVGGGPGGSERVAEALVTKYPALNILGTYSPDLGPINDAENDKIVSLVNEACPDVLWVGLGGPLQEKWIWRNRSQLNTSIALGVGAAFDDQMGREKRAPDWMRDHMMDGFYRVTQRPSLLWRKRYDRWLVSGVIPISIEVMRRRVFK